MHFLFFPRFVSRLAFGCVSQVLVCAAFRQVSVLCYGELATPAESWSLYQKPYLLSIKAEVILYQKIS
jgi:hypothetical protein